MGHWQPKTEITRDAESDLPIQAIVGRTAKKPTAVYQQDLPDMTGQITRSNDYVAVPKTTPVEMVAAPPAPPQVEFAPPPAPPVMPAQQTVQNHQQPTGQTMSNDHNQPCHQHPVQAHPAQNWYGGQPMQYAAQPLVVQQLPMPSHNVQTDKAPDVTYRKGILGIGSEAFDLTGEMMDSFEFKAKFIMFLQSVLASDLNVQAALFTPNEKKQDAEIAGLTAADKVLKHAIQCAYYEDGDIVFPGLKNDCGKDARVKVPPVDGIKYDLATSTLSIGSAKLVLPVAAMVSAVINQALNAASASLPKVKKAEDITDLPVFDRDDQCAPAKSATLAQLSEAIVAEGIPQACEAGKLKEVTEPTGLLAFGAKKCREFGFTSLADFLKALNKALLLAPKSKFPVELRGFGAVGGADEERYPVKVTTKKVLTASGTVVAAGDTATGLASTKISLVITEADFYLLSAEMSGAVIVDTDATLNKGIADRRIAISVGGGVITNQGDACYFDTANAVMPHTATSTAALYIPAGAVVEGFAFYTGSGVMAVGPGGLSLTLRAIPLGLTSITINPA
jgi:hypothetical protein